MTAGEQIRTAYENDPDTTVQAFLKALRDFGYDLLSDDQVREACEAVKDGEQPQDIIQMFVRGWFQNGVE